jgi:hypothetical protein
MTGMSYAMFWHTDEGPRLVGRVEVTPHCLDLEATVPPAPTQRIAFDDIAGVTVNRGVLSLVRRAGPRLTIGSLDRPGALRELAELLVASIVVG